MRKVVENFAPHSSREIGRGERVLLIYRDRREGYAYASRLLQKSIKSGRIGVYISCFEETEELRESLRALGEWVKEMEEGGMLKIIGSEKITNYLEDLLRNERKETIEGGDIPEGSQIYLDLGLYTKENMIMKLCDEGLRDVIPEKATLIMGYDSRRMAGINIETLSKIMRAQDSIIFSFREGRRAFVEAVEFVMCKVLGRVPCDTILNILEKRYHIEKESISEEFRVFRELLTELFGYGGLIIEKIILKEFHTRITMER
ncbi:MAG: hypothetical protein ACETVR_01185 [Candidatus Bathyarchaeia archaeon]